MYKRCPKTMSQKFNYRCHAENRKQKNYSTDSLHVEIVYNNCRYLVIYMKGNIYLSWNWP